MSEKLEAAMAVKSNYLYVAVPVAILHAKDITRLDSAVWGTYFARERLNQERVKSPQLSLSQVAFWSGTDKRGAKRSIEKLVELGYLVETRAGRSTAAERGVRSYQTRIPKQARGRKFLIASSLEGIETDLDDESEDEGGGSTTHGGVGQRPTGGGSTTHRKGGERPTLKDREDQEEDKREDPSAATSSPPGFEDTTSKPTGLPVEVHETLRDEESRAATTEIKEEVDTKRERAAARRSSGPAAGDEEFLREPSKRPELNRWREKTPVGLRWSARDLVGYFACRYFELRGEESSEFFATSDHLFRHIGTNVGKYTKRWLDGDFRRAIVIVDRIFARAEARNMPVKLGYFFTPANEGAARRLLEKVLRRPSTPAERNDRAGADTPENQARIAQMQADFVADKRERDGREDEKVRRDERSSAEAS